MAQVIRDTPNEIRNCVLEGVRMQPTQLTITLLSQADYVTVSTWTGDGLVVDEELNKYKIPNLVPIGVNPPTRQITYKWLEV